MRVRAQKPEDVTLLVEVSDSSLKLDRGGKLQLYAEAGIQEYWVINLIDGVVEIYTEVNSVAATYGAVRTAKPGETIQLPEGLAGEIAVNSILRRTPKA